MTRTERQELSRYWAERNHPKKGQQTFVHPIKSLEHIAAIKKLLKNRPRDLLLFTLGINNGLRTCDLLRLKVGQVRHMKPGDHIRIVESKTKKPNLLFVNDESYKALKNYLSKTKYNKDGDWLFPNQFDSSKSISTCAVNLAIKGWGRRVGIVENLGAHTLRKSFVFIQRTVHKVPLELLMVKLRHSSIQMTLRYADISEGEILTVLANGI